MISVAKSQYSPPPEVIASYNWQTGWQESGGRALSRAQPAFPRIQAILVYTVYITVVTGEA